MAKIGDILWLEAHKGSKFYPGIRCEVLKVDRVGKATKIRAILPNEELGKIGFFKEGEDYVTMEYQICVN